MLFYLSSPYLLPTSTLVTHVCSMQLINVAQASLSQVKNTLASLPCISPGFTDRSLAPVNTPRWGEAYKNKESFPSEKYNNQEMFLKGLNNLMGL